MKVETGGLVFDDSDKRCTIIVRCAQKDGVASYLACISCYDISSGGSSGIMVLQIDTC